MKIESRDTSPDTVKERVENIIFAGVGGITFAISDAVDKGTAILTATVDGSTVEDVGAADVVVDSTDLAGTGTDLQTVLEELEDQIDAVQADLDVGTLRVSRGVFVEEAGAGTYTVDFAEVPDLAIILAYGWQTTAAWDADTTAIELGDADPDRFLDSVDVDAADEEFFWVAATAYPLIVDTSLAAVITTTGTGGTTGRSTVIVVWSAPIDTAAVYAAT